MQPLKDVVLADATPDAVRRSAIESLAERGAEHADFIRGLDAEGRPFHIRASAVAALVGIDVNDAAKRAAALLGSAKPDADPSNLVAAFLQREGGGDALAAALQKTKLDPDVAKLALRYANASGREAPSLTAQLRAAAGIGSEPPELTPELTAQLVKEVMEKGDAARGEAVFRRADMACFQCHAIGGAGSSLAPDLRAIGASSPVDYLIESLVAPAKSVKDGYESTTVATKKGEIFTGIKVSRDDKQVVLRDATHDAIAVPIDSIRREKAGGSLMPAGLTDNLTRGELLDLVRFMAELGKPGAYGPDNALLVRRWRVMDGKAPDGTPAYTLVSGVLPLNELPSGAKLKAEIDVTSPGKVGFHLGDAKGLKLSIDGKPVETSSDVQAELAKGVHTITLEVDPAARAGQGVRVEVRDVAGSSGHAQPVGGR
jgi:putative heme-binding domain-containing protein